MDNKIELNLLQISRGFRYSSITREPVVSVIMSDNRKPPEYVTASLLTGGALHDWVGAWERLGHTQHRIGYWLTGIIIDRRVWPETFSKFYSRYLDTVRTVLERAIMGGWYGGSNEIFYIDDSNMDPNLVRRALRDVSINGFRLKQPAGSGGFKDLELIYDG